jgi:hypothetical protein
MRDVGFLIRKRKRSATSSGFSSEKSVDWKYWGLIYGLPF